MNTKDTKSKGLEFSFSEFDTPTAPGFIPSCANPGCATPGCSTCSVTELGG